MYYFKFHSFFPSKQIPKHICRRNRSMYIYFY